MSRWKALQEKRKQFTRFQALKSIFSSVIMTVVVVTAAVVFIPKSPEATITYVEPFNDHILYQIAVTDPDNAIIEGSLKVVLENQLEHHESALIAGENNGFFEALTEASNYEMKVLADKGFGLEVLATEAIATKPKTGARITEVDIKQGEFEMNEITVGYLIHDPENLYQQIDIRYGLVYPEEEAPFFYQTMTLDQDEDHVLLAGIHGGNARLHLILEGYLLSGEPVVLDERMVQLPYQLYASLYLTEVSDHKAVVSIYADMCCVMDISYWLQLKINQRVIQEEDLNFTDEQDMHEAMNFIFTKLKPGQTYQITLMAAYQDPYTMQSVEADIGYVEFTTLEAFDAEYMVIELDDAYEITISVDDPFNQCEEAFYAIYEISEFGTWQMFYQTMSWDEAGESKTITFLVSKPSYERYRIDIGIDNSDESYYKIVLENIIHDSEVNS